MPREAESMMAVNPVRARRSCLAWHPRQGLSLSLWKQVAQHVNPFSLDGPAPHIDTVLEPGDSSILVRPLVPLGCGTHP